MSVPKGHVVVVGAGPVGLVTALGLAQRGLKVTVLEREAAVIASPRAMVYHCAVLPGLEKLGLLDDVLQAGFTATRLAMHVFKTGEKIGLDVGVLEGHEPYAFNVHLGQHELARIALEHLRELPGTEVLFGTSVLGITEDGDSVTVTAESSLEPLEIKADYVVGTDGARSQVRKLIGLELEGMTWPERFVATNIRYDMKKLGYEDANMVIDDTYGCVVARIDEEDLWRVTFAEDADLPEEELPDRIATFFKTLLKGDDDYRIREYSPYFMHQRSAPTYRKGRVLLAGDAAHITNPTGGMGLTSGLFDSFVLSEALAAVVNGVVGDEVLDAYSEQRRKVFLEYASPTAVRFKTLVYNPTPEILAEALAGLRMAAADENIGRMAMALAQPVETPSLVPAG